MHAFESATCGNLLFSYFISPSNGSVKCYDDRVILERVKVVANILHWHCDGGIQQYDIRN